MNTYISVIDYLKQPTGQTIASYVGSVFRLPVLVAGATSIPVPASALTADLQAYDPLTIFDGPNSEQVSVASYTPAGSTSIPLQGSGLAFAHSAGTPCCSDGSSGSLAEQILTASRWIEDICHQALWSTAYTNEILTMPTMRAAIDNQYNLHFRPRHFPITALTGVTLQTSQLYTIALDPSQAIIDSDQQTVDVPNINMLASQLPPTQSSPWLPTPISRQMNAWITLAYTAGFAPGQLPWPVTRACTLLTSECFSQLENPVGADSIVQGKRNVSFVLRGDQSGESLLVKRAKDALSPYIAQSF